jgi:predicted small lipoprotein YifL
VSIEHFSRRGLAVCLLLCASIAACGKKGPPLPPLTRIPSPPAALTVRRVADDVLLTFRVPSQNIDGSMPVDIATVEVFALTADAPPSRRALIQRAKRIAMFPVAVPPAEPASGAAPSAPPAGTLTPGEEVIVRDTLTGDALVPVAIPSEGGRGAAVPPAPNRPANPAPTAVAGAAAPAETPIPPAPRRYYVVVASSTHQRASPNGAEASIPIAAAPEPPRLVPPSYDDRLVTLTWMGGGTADTYNVYRDTPTESIAPALSAPRSLPAPLNPAPLDVMTYREPVQFGRRVCYRVRTLRREGSGELVEGQASEEQCLQAVDTFAPAPPVGVTVVAGTREITVMWSANAEPDLAGYLVLRGTPGDDTLAPITSSPIKETRFVDRDVTSGVRYVYAVVAVDNAPAANRSAPSARDETTAR